MSDDEIQASVVPPDPEQVALDNEAATALASSLREQERRIAYTIEADPLFFQWQRGEATEQDWLDKVAEIRARYPSPDGQ